MLFRSPADLKIIGTQFVTVGGDSKDIQDLVDVDVLSAGDQMMYFDNGSYNVYIFDTSTYDEDYEVDYGPGFNDPEGLRAVRGVKPGEAYWFRSGTEKEITLAGEVPDNTPIEVSGNDALSLVSMQRPMEINIQDIHVEGVSVGDQLLFFDNGTYNVYLYDSSTYDEDYEVDYGPGWNDPEGLRATRTLKLGEGFWIRPKAATVKISFPE